MSEEQSEDNLVDRAFLQALIDLTTDYMRIYKGIEMERMGEWVIDKDGITFTAKSMATQMSTLLMLQAIFSKRIYRHERYKF